jgi:2',3'-cyclic-nucleotide 2'-phosphodiesterase (5'-nucleotidase family)
MRVHPLLKALVRASRPVSAGLAGLLVLGILSPAASEETPRFGILVQTDSRGELRPCHCPGKAINSLGRRSGVFGLARAFRYPVAVLDGGDFIPAPEDTLAAELRDLMVEAMELMKYDAVALGELDLFAGPEFLRRLARALPLVGTNLQAGPGLGVDIPPVRWMEAAGTRVAVLAVLDPLLFYSAPNAFDLYGDDLVLRDAAESLTEALVSVRAEAGLVILLAHASFEEIDRLLEAVPGIDVVVQGHEPEAPTPGTPHRGALLVVPEPRSRFVSQLTISLAPPAPVEVQTARVWDLKRTHYEDSRLDALVETFETRYGTP